MLSATHSSLSAYTSERGDCALAITYTWVVCWVFACVCVGDRENKARQMEWSTKGTLIDNSASVLCSAEHQSLPPSQKKLRGMGINACVRSNPCRGEWQWNSHCFRSHVLKIVVLLIQLSLSLFPHLGLVWPPPLQTNQVCWASLSPRWVFKVLQRDRGVRMLPDALACCPHAGLVANGSDLH